MTRDHRKERGRETEKLVAAHMRTLFPFAQQVGAGRPGCDLTETPGVAVEIKSRRGLDLPAWLRQASHNAGNGRALPVLVVRGDGQGPATVGSWAAVLTLDDLIDLLGDAGFGTPQDTRQRGPAQPPEGAPMPDRQDHPWTTSPPADNPPRQPFHIPEDPHPERSNITKPATVLAYNPTQEN